MTNVDLALSIVLGVALAAATGFRVFLPMLVASGGLYRTSPVGRQLRMARDASGPDNARCGGCGRSGRLLRSGCREPARRRGYTSRVCRWNDPVSGGHDRRAAYAKMDGGGHCGGWRGRPHARRYRDASGKIYRLDRRTRQPAHRNWGTRRCAPDFAPGPGGAVRRTRAGRFVLVVCDTSAPAASSKSATCK